jgi:PemK-like, MazF-like toxin of type II toxin-antitoxin system
MGRIRSFVTRLRRGTGSRPSGPEIAYAPEMDGDADPGEVVWGWVPYEDDPAQGKDRPLLVIGRDGGELLVVPLSSHDHAARPDAHEWVALGRGAWDRSGRTSFADAERVMRYRPADVRREGAALRRDRFDAVVARARELNRWLP